MAAKPRSSTSDRAEARFGEARAWLDRLPQAFLAKALRGELVRRGPQDRPAEGGLERMRTPQGAQARAGRRRQRLGRH
jgi:hypothetical protein